MIGSILSISALIFGGSSYTADLVGESCRYVMYRNWTTRISFDDADDFCATEQGTYLANIFTSAQNSEASGLVDAELGENTAWIGYNDQDVEGTFEWTSGLSGSYTNWEPSAPNNVLNFEHCTEIFGDSGLWNDIGCDGEDPRSWTYSFLCQKSDANTCTYINYGGVGFDYNRARDDICIAQQGTYLPTIINSDELEDFRQLLISTGESRGVWIGYNVTTSSYDDGRTPESGFNLPWWFGFPNPLSPDCTYAVCYPSTANCNQIYFLTKPCWSTDNLVFCNT